MVEQTQYYCKDFDFDQIREEVESNGALRYHIEPFKCPPSSPYLYLNGSEVWEKFHKCHISGRVFKERKYLLKEFPELLRCDKVYKVLEVGCGNGSTALPILRGNGSIHVYACDCSKDALKRASEMIAAADCDSFKQRFYPFQCDFSLTAFPDWLCCGFCHHSLLTERSESSSDFKFFEDLNDCSYASPQEGRCCINGVDFVTLVFTLSAVPFALMPSVIAKCIFVLKPGGFILFRDYGLYDMAMLRSDSNRRVGFREYIRHDGTHSYFFSLDIVRELFTGAGFVVLELDYCYVNLVNHKNGRHMRRVWVHGKFQKPMSVDHLLLSPGA